MGLSADRTQQKNHWRRKVYHFFQLNYKKKRGEEKQNQRAERVKRYNICTIGEIFKKKVILKKKQLGEIMPQITAKLNTHLH